MTTAIATMTCGCLEWECDLLGHIGCTVRETRYRPMGLGPRPRPRTSNPFSIAARLDPNGPARAPRPSVPRPGQLFGPRVVAEREEARQEKRTNEVTRDVTRSNESDEVLRTLRARLSPPPRAVVAPPRYVPTMPKTRQGDLTPPARPARNRLTCERVRVWEIAQRIGKPSAEVVQLLREHGEWVANAQSTVVAPAATAFITAHEGV